MRLNDLPEIGFVFSNRSFRNERKVLDARTFRYANPGSASVLPFRGGLRVEYEEGQRTRRVRSAWLVSPGWVDKMVLRSTLGNPSGDAGSTRLLATIS